MPRLYECCYCHASYDHASRVQCVKWEQDRAISIFNTNTDIDPRLSSWVGCMPNWFIDANGNGPSNEEWLVSDGREDVRAGLVKPPQGRGITLPRSREMYAQSKRVLAFIFQLRYIRFPQQHRGVEDLDHIVARVSLRDNMVTGGPSSEEALSEWGELCAAMRRISFDTTRSEMVVTNFTDREQGEQMLSIYRDEVHRVAIDRFEWAKRNAPQLVYRKHRPLSHRVIAERIIMRDARRRVQINEARAAMRVRASEEQAARRTAFAASQEQWDTARTTQRHAAAPVSVLPDVKEVVIAADECCICMNEFGQTNRAILRCGHQFCGDCIFTHLQGAQGTRCPCCRTEFAARLRGFIPYDRNSGASQAAPGTRPLPGTLTQMATGLSEDQFAQMQHLMMNAITGS